MSQRRLCGLKEHSACWTGPVDFVYDRSSLCHSEDVQFFLAETVESTECELVSPTQTGTVPGLVPLHSVKAQADVGAKGQRGEIASL